MAAGERAQCRSCGAPVVWTRTAAGGRPMPVDAEPVEDGNVHLVHVRDGAHETIEAYIGPGGTHVSHFATCPDREAWRRP